jgi:hypothetical protein
MSSRDFGVVALGRFLAVERYCETQLSPTHQLPGPGRGRTGGSANRPEARSDSAAAGVGAQPHTLRRGTMG